MLRKKELNERYELLVINGRRICGRSDGWLKEGIEKSLDIGVRIPLLKQEGFICLNGRDYFLENRGLQIHSR